MKTWQIYGRINKEKEGIGMKNKFKGFIIGFITAIVLTGGLSLAAQTVRIVINGNELVPVDANGKRVDPLIVDGTTYLPVRAIATALGLDVAWDGENYTVSLTKPKQETEETGEELTEKPTQQENVTEGIAQVTANDNDTKTSKLWDKEKGENFIVDGIYMLGEWGNYKIVDGTLIYFEIIDHYGWTKATVVKIGWDNLQRFDPRFHIKLEDGTILTVVDRKLKIDNKWYDMRTENASEGLYGMVRSAIGIGQIWYKTDEDGYITRIDTIK